MLFTENLKNIFREVNETGPKLNVNIETVKAVNMRNGGFCILKRDNKGIPYIAIEIRDDLINEDVVSHELLHALNIKKGFGISRSNTIGDIPFNEISKLLHSIIEHKGIYERQKALGIDISEVQKYKANNIFKEVNKEDTIIAYNTVLNALLLLECLVASYEYKDLFVERMRTNFAQTYELAKTLEEELFSDDINNAEVFRKKYIKGLRICDDHLSKHMNKYYKLTENISIGFIPSEFQLSLKAEQVFDFIESINSLIIISKKDNQASFIIEKTDKEALKSMAVEDLIGHIDGLVSTRKSQNV